MAWYPKPPRVNIYTVHEYSVESRRELGVPICSNVKSNKRAVSAKIEQTGRVQCCRQMIPDLESFTRRSSYDPRHTFRGVESGL